MCLPVWVQEASNKLSSSGNVSGKSKMWCLSSQQTDLHPNNHANTALKWQSICSYEPAILKESAFRWLLS